MKANPWFWLLSEMGLDGSPVSHQQHLQAMSFWVFISSVKGMIAPTCKSVMKSCLQTPSAYTRWCLLRQKYLKMYFYYCPRGCGDRDEDLLAWQMVSSPFTNPLLLIMCTYVCVCVWLCMCEHRYTWPEETLEFQFQAVGTCLIGCWEVRSGPLQEQCMVLINPHLSSSWEPLVVTQLNSVGWTWSFLFPPFLIVFSAVEHYVKKIDYSKNFSSRILGNELARQATFPSQKRLYL